MSKAKKDVERERRTEMEILADAYDDEERAMGCYYYLEAKLQFSFTATCVPERMTSPLRKGDEVEILGLAPEDGCQNEMFVLMR